MNDTPTPSATDIILAGIKARDALNELTDGLNSFVAENGPALNNKIDGQLRAVLKSCQDTSALIFHHVPDAHNYLTHDLAKMKQKEIATTTGGSTPPATDQP